MDLSNKVLYEKLFQTLGYSFPKTLPALFSCPVCKDQQSLLIRRVDSNNHYFCTSCRFIGDNIQLYKAVSSIGELGTAANDMIGAGLFGNDVAELKSEVYHYLGELGVAREILANTLREGWERLEHGGANSYNDMWSLGLFDGSSYGKHLFPHVGIFSPGEMVDKLNMDPMDVKMLRNKYNKYLCVLLFDITNSLTGLIVLKKKDAILIQHIDHKKEDDNGLGFVLSHMPIADCTLVFTNPIFAAYFASKCSKAGARINIVYCPPDTKPSTLNARCRGEVFVIGANNVECLKLGYSQPNYQLVPLDEVTSMTMETSSPVDFVDVIRGTSTSSNKLLVDYVSDATDVEILSLMEEVGISKDDICRVINESKSDNKQRLETLLLSKDDSKQIQVFDKTFVITKDQWSHSGVLVTDAPFSVTSVTTDDSGEPKASGQISFRDKKYTFMSPLSSVQKKTADWLQFELIKQGAGIPVINKKYSKMLYDIATAVESPVVKASSDRTGWDKNEVHPTFRMPQFTVSRAGISPASMGVFPENIGIDVTIPQQLTPAEIDDLLESNPKNRLFWTVMGVMMFNCINAFNGDPVYNYCIVTPDYEKASNFVGAINSLLGGATLNFSRSTENFLRQQEIYAGYSAVMTGLQLEKWKRMPGLLSFLKTNKSPIFTVAPKLDFINIPNGPVEWIKTEVPTFELDGRYNKFIRIFWTRLAEVLREDKLPVYRHMLVRNAIESCAAGFIKAICEKAGKRDRVVEVLAGEASLVTLKDRNSLEHLISSCLIWVKEGSLEMVNYDTPGLPKESDRNKIIYDSTQYYFPRDKIIPFYQREGFIAPSTAEIELALKKINTETSIERSFKHVGQHWWIIPFEEVAYHV